MTPLDRAYYRGVLDYIRSFSGTGDEAATARQNVHQAVADFESALSGADGAKVKLNIGSADALLNGFINVDIVPAPGVMAADLARSWPWRDDSVDYVRASHVIEHLPDKIFTMNELWRVLKPGSNADIVVPTTDGPGAWQDPTHVSYWNRRSFLYFELGSPYQQFSARQYGIAAKFRIVRELLLPTVDGPILFITLQAVKP